MSGAALVTLPMMLTHFCGSPLGPKVWFVPYQTVMAGASADDWNSVPGCTAPRGASADVLGVAGRPPTSGGIVGSLNCSSPGKASGAVAAGPSWAANTFAPASVVRLNRRSNTNGTILTEDDLVIFLTKSPHDPEVGQARERAGSATSPRMGNIKNLTRKRVGPASIIQGRPSRGPRGGGRSDKLRPPNLTV